MKRLLLIIAAILCFATASIAQTAARYVLTINGAPVGSCSISGSGYAQVYVNRANGDFYVCSGALGTSSGTWVLSGNHSAGTGSVTSVSVVTANGFSGSVATATTTPAITINNPTALVATTSTQAPFFKSAAADTADAGAVRLGNAENIAWEKATPGTDWTLGVSAADVLTTNAAFSALTLTGQGLTSGRVPIVGASGLIGDDADLTFATDTLTATKIVGSTSITDSGLTSGRLTFAGASGLLSDDTDLTFATDTLTSTKLIIGAGTALTSSGSGGTVATLAGNEELTNKTLNASVGKGTWTASGTWTLPAFTLGGTVSGGGQQLNNIIIGTTTPLAGSFTTLTGSTSTTTPIVKPASNSTTAIQLTNADGTSSVLNVDTTNTRVGIGMTAPGATLEVNGNIYVSNSAGFLANNGQAGMVVRTAGNVDFYNGNAVRVTLDTSGNVGMVAKTTSYNNIATAGLGLPALYSAPAQSATKTGNFTVLSYTPPATAGTYRVTGVITTTSATNTGTVQFTLDYVDSQGTTHTADIIPLQDAAGTWATTKTGASKEFYSAVKMFTINNAATAIVLKVVITGTVSYTVTGSVEQIN